MFVAGLLPFAGTFLEHYPDERNYTNAAIAMVQTGEWVTPRWPDGHPNVHKPIAVYWIVAASYALFGVGLTASRAAFMATGALVVALTYALARRLGAPRETALLAAVIAMAMPQLALASMRAIPDVVLCLALLVSAYGFLSLVILGRRERHAYWAAYLGAALAVETKGLLAVAFVAYAWAFAWLDGSRATAPARVRALVHLPSMLVAALVAASWYAAMYWLHGPGPSAVFVGDQIVWNLKVLDGSPLYRIPLYAGSLFANLLPWSLLLIPLAIWDRRSLAPADPDGRRLLRFVLWWSASMAVIFGLGMKLEPRYVLPAAPLWAILLAGALTRADSRLRQRMMAWLLRLALAAVAVLGLVLTLLDAAILGPRAALLTLARFAAVVIAIALATRLPSRLRGEGRVRGGADQNAGEVEVRGGADTACLPRAIGVSLAVFLAFPLTAIAIGPALEPDAGVTAMARDLEAARARGGGIALVAGPEYLANKLRVLTAGRVPIDSWSPLPAARERWPGAIVLSASDPAARDLSGYRAQVFATEVRSIPVGGLLSALVNGRAAEYLDGRRDRYIIAIKPPPPS